MSTEEMSAEDADRLWHAQSDKRKVQVAGWVFGKPDQRPSPGQLSLLSITEERDVS